MSYYQPYSCCGLVDTPTTSNYEKSIKFGAIFELKLGTNFKHYPYFTTLIFSQGGYPKRFSPTPVDYLEFE